MSALKPVKASKLIKILERKIKKDGDLPVYMPKEAFGYFESEEIGDHEVVCVGVNTWLDSKTEKPTHFMLMDPSAVDALC